MTRMRWWHIVIVLIAVGVIAGVLALTRSGREDRTAEQSAEQDERASRRRAQAPWDSDTGDRSRTRRVRTPGTVQVDLNGDVRIVGHVVSPGGLPLADASVICASERGNGYRKTDASGRFEYTTWPEPEFVLLAQWPSPYLSSGEEGLAESDLAPTLYGPFHIEPGHETRDIEIVVAPGASLTGKVTDERGAPIEGANVGYRRALTPEEQANPLVARLLDDSHIARTGDDGSYQCGGLAAGEFEVYADHRDYLEADARIVAVAEGGTTTGVDFILNDGVAISGRVMAWDDEPLAGAEVSVDTEDTGGWSGGFGGLPGEGSSITDAEGRFEMRGLEPRSYVLRVGLPFAYVNLYAGQHTAPCRDLELKTCSPPRIKGRVIDKVTRQPVEEFMAGTEVGHPWDRNAQVQDGSETPRHADGRFELVCEPGRHTLYIYKAPGYTAVRIDAGRCLEGMEPEELLVELVRGATLLFYPTSAEDGRLVPGVEINSDVAFVASGETDENGLGRIEDVPPGQHTFELFHPDFAYKRITVDVAQEEGEQVVDVVLDAGLTVQGRVVSKEDGSAVPDAAVFLVSPASLYDRRHEQFICYYNGPPLDQLETRADADGRFTLTQVARMKYGLYVAADGYTPAGRLVDFTAGGGEELVVELSRGGRISGSVKTASGDPVQYVRVEISQSKPWTSGATRTDGEGRFELGVIEPGSYEIAVEADDLRVTRTVDVREGQETKVGIVLGGVTLSGTIARRGEPVADVRVELASLGARLGAAQAASALTKTDEQGGYRFVNLDPGRYLVCPAGGLGFSSPGYAWGGEPRWGVLIGAQDERLDIELGGTAVSGTVCRADKSAAGGARVTLLPGDDGGERPVALAAGCAGEPRAAATDFAGGFSFDGVMPGRYRMVVEKEGYAAQVAEIEKRDGEDLAGLEVTLKKDAPISAVVSVDEGEMPYSVMIAICDKDGRLVRRTDWTPVDADTGRVWIDGLGQGEYTLLAWAADRAVCRREITVTEEGAPEVRFEFVEGRKIEVEVTDVSGKPVPATSLILDPGGDSALADWLADSERTDGDGKAAFGCVTDGACTLWVLRDGYKEASVRIDMSSADQPIEVTLEQAPSE